MTAETQVPLADLLAAAAAAGHRLRINSAHRGYREQARLFATTREPGRAARPGHSEHQLGTTVDLRLPSQAAIDWLQTSAPSFGFVQSYPGGKQRITGYRPEPWHYRYVGPQVAKIAAGRSLEELFRAGLVVGESGACSACPQAASRTTCGSVSEAGLCRGDVLTWCYDGALAAVDCTSSKQRCGLTTAGAPDCLDVPAEATPQRSEAD